MSNASSDLQKPDPTKQQTWSPAAALAIVFISFAGLPIIAGFILSFLPVILGWSTAYGEQWLRDSALSSFLFALLVEGLTVLLLIRFFVHKKVSFVEAVAFKRPTWLDLGYAIVATVVYIALFAVALTMIEQIIPVDTSQEQALGFDRAVTGSGLFLAFVSLVVLPPLFEEILFRGFLYGTLRRNHVSFVVSTIVTSLVFGVLHIFGGAEGEFLWIAVIDTFILSLVLCYLREKTGSIWASIYLHAIKNGFVFLNLFIIGRA